MNFYLNFISKINSETGVSLSDFLYGVSPVIFYLKYLIAKFVLKFIIGKNENETKGFLQFLYKIFLPMTVQRKNKFKNKEYDASDFVNKVKHRIITNINRIMLHFIHSPNQTKVMNSKKKSTSKLPNLKKKKNS
jgi:hypothetical protein